VTTIDELSRKLSDLTRRVTSLEGGAAGSPGSPDLYTPNVISNGDMESGSAGWALIFFFGASGATLSVETVAPEDGLRSLKATEAAASSSRLTWIPTGSTTSPTVGTDVFTCAPGQTWLISALMQSTIATAHARIYALGGASPSDCYGGGGGTFLTAADIPLAPATPTVLQGTVTVPAGMNYLTFVCAADDGATSAGGAWSWLLDDVSLQRRL